MRVTLTVTDGPHLGQTFSFAGHETFLVGRSKRAHFRLQSKDRYFSRIHFLIEVNPPSCRLLDMGSRNGTHVNGERVRRVALQNGDRIRAGKTVLQVSVEDSPAEAVPSTAQPDVVQTLHRVEPAPVPTPDRPTPLSARISRPLMPAPAEPPRLIAPRAAPVACWGCSQPLPSETVHAGLCPACDEVAQSQPQPIPGYRLLRKLGQGAMGMVYLAVASKDGRAVALKTVTPAVAGSPAQVQRFLREAEILRQLQHPHIVGFRDMGEAEGIFYFAMDHVVGRDAARLLKREGPFTIGRAVTLVCQLLDALAYAHARGFVHRDIKPSNLLLTQEAGQEMLKVVDFGLARVYQASQLSGLTLTGDIGGTMAFMPPEQITRYREACPPADQYASAATLYNLLTASFIHDLPSAFHEQILMVLQDDPIALATRRPDIPAPLAAAIHRALAREAEDRHPDVTAFRTALLPYRGQ